MRGGDDVVVRIALPWLAAGFADGALQRLDGLFLRRLGTSHVEDFFLHDGAVQIVGAAVATGAIVPYEHRAPLREYVVRESRPSYVYDDEVVVGRELRSGPYES